MDEIRNMLDILMGKERNQPLELVEPSPGPNGLTFTDQRVCKYYLVEFCPHELFPNTKSDLGPCRKEHSDQIKEIYTNLDPDTKEKYSSDYEERMINYLEHLIHQVDMRIRRAQERIEAPLPSEGDISFEDLPQDKRDRVKELHSQISMLLKQSEDSGAAGKIEEAEMFFKQATALRRQAERIHSHSTPFDMYVQRDKSLQVCVTCGAMQSAADSMSRFESHVTGKQHIGYERIRNFLKDLYQRRDARETNRRSKGSLEDGEEVDSKKRKDSEHTRYESRSREDRSRYRDKERRGRDSGRDGRDRDGARDRDGGRDGRDRDGARDRDRDRDRDGGSRDRDRDRESKGRERDRSRERRDPRRR